MKSILESIRTSKLAKRLALCLGLSPLGAFALGDEDPGKSVLDDVSVGFSSAFVKDYVAPVGFEIGDGPVNQSELAVGYKNATGFVWSNFDFDAMEFHKVNYGVSVNFPLIEEGRHTLDTWIGLEYWQYPSGLLGEDDIVAKTGLNYNGSIVNARFLVANMFEHGDSEGGQHYNFRVSRPTIVHKNEDLQVIVNPSVSMSYLDNFLGNDGVTHVSPRAGVRFDTDMFGVNVFGAYKVGVHEDVEDGLYGGVSVSLGTK